MADSWSLTNAIMEIMPVTRIERKTVGNEKPGPITTQLAEAYKKATAVEASDARQSK
jgi:branched-subunit amino acid aminotransferase/4-amino-4-deoxychorismate lyase